MMNRLFTLCAALVWVLTADASSPAPQAGQDTQPEPVRSQWTGCRVAFLGDSITDSVHVGTERCYWEFLADFMGLRPLCYGINGNRMDGILRQAERLLKDHGQEVDAILIFAGTNDYNGSVPLGEWYRTTQRDVPLANGKTGTRPYRLPDMNPDTFRGRINRLMDFLKTNYPTKQIILLTPLHRGFARFSAQNVQPEEASPNGLGLYVDAYVNAVKEAGNVWAVPVIDLNALSGLYPMTDSHTRYFHRADTDRLHPNTAGHRRMALTLMYQLMALPARF